MRDDEDISQDDLFQIKMLIKNNLKNFLKINIQKINGQSSRCINCMSTEK